jgi:hypothetical protein
VVFGAIHGEPIEADDFNTLEVSRGRSDLPDPLVNTESWPFARIVQYGNDQIAEKRRGPFNQIHMTICQGVKAAGIERPHRIRTVGNDQILCS